MSENSTIQYRTKFCVQHNQKDSQHKHSSESFHKNSIAVLTSHTLLFMDLFR